MFVAGCAVEEAEVTNTSEHEIGGTLCPPWICENSPETLYMGLHELHLGEKLNAQGFRLEPDATGRASIFKNGLRYELHVDHGRLAAVGYGMKLQGQALVGAEMHVLRADGSPLYYIRIERTRNGSFGIDPKTPLEFYKLSWKDPTWPSDASGKPICNGGAYVEEGALYGMRQDEVLVFVGDRIDGDALTITPDPDKLWMSIGCAGHTLAKLHITHNTTSSNIVPDWAGNQATLKMYAADFCNTGTAWTLSGTPIRWKGGPVSTYASYVSGIEARWNENGATCLNTTRINQPVAPWFLTGAGMKGAIIAECNSVGHPLPPCTGSVHSLAGAKRVSALP
jgi:hypothetical protein